MKALDDTKGLNVLRQLQDSDILVGLAFHRQPQTAVERRPYRVLRLPLLVAFCALTAFCEVNGQTINVPSGTVEYGEVLSGQDALTKTGAGTLTLSNLRNTYAGSTTVSAGHLYFSSIANIGELSSLGCPQTAAQAALTVNGSSTARLVGVGEQTTDRPIHVGDKATFYVNSGAALTTTGPWTGRFSVRGSGTIRVASRLTASSISSCSRTDKGVAEFLCPSNTFTCAVTASDGTFRVPNLADGGMPSALGAGTQIMLGQREYKNIGRISYFGTTDASCNRDITVCGYTNSTLTANHYGGSLRNETAGTCVTYAGTMTTYVRGEYPLSMPALYLEFPLHPITTLMATRTTIV